MKPLISIYFIYFSQSCHLNFFQRKHYDFHLKLQSNSKAQDTHMTLRSPIFPPSGCWVSVQAEMFSHTLPGIPESYLCCLPSQDSKWLQNPPRARGWALVCNSTFCQFIIQDSLHTSVLLKEQLKELLVPSPIENPS
jgi:hypothetical protein